MDAPGGKPVSEERPAALPVSAPAASVDTGKSEVADTGNDDTYLLAILANKEIGHERFDDSEWRIEVYTNRNGRRYWNHRRRGKRGGKDNWRYGGKFDDLNPDRQAQYWQRAKSG